MSRPTHRTAPCCSYLVTTKCGQSRHVFAVTENAEILLATLFHYRDSAQYLLHEFVVMPDHLQLIVTPGRDTSLEKAVQLIKGGSSHQIHRARGHKMEIWQEGFYDWTIRDVDDWKSKSHYVHNNPVRALLVRLPSEWPYSSASGKFVLDPMPARYGTLASEAKA